MNIWIFNHYAAPIEYYPHGRPHYFAKNLAEKGHIVTVFAASSVHNSDYNLIMDNAPFITQRKNGVRYVYIKTDSYKGNGRKRIVNMFQYMFGLFKIHRRFQKPDCILAMSVHPLACVAGIKLAKKYRCKCIVDVADLWPESIVAYGYINRKNPLLKLMYQGEKWIYKKADNIIFTMQGGRDYIKDKGWSKEIDLKKVKHINNGLDLEQFDKNQKTYHINIKELDRTDTFKVIYTGSVRKANGLNHLIAAAMELKCNPQIEFFIFGDGGEKEKLSMYCKKNQLNHVYFMGKVDKKYIPYILSKGDLNVLNYSLVGKSSWKYGGSHNKQFEYLASAKPSYSNIEWGYSLINKYHCGIEENAVSGKQIAESILSFFHMDQKNYEIMCRNARKVSEAYDFKKLSNKLDKIILECVKS